MDNVSSFKDAYLSEEYVTLFVLSTKDLVNILKDVDYAYAYKISDTIFYVSVLAQEYHNLVGEFREIFRVDVSYPYTLSSIEPIQSSSIAPFHGETFLNLKGKNTVAAIIDTGIDYLNPQFQNDDGTTRIIGIWDQTIESNKTTDIPAGFFGTFYTKEEINKAIEVFNKGENPYDIVPSRDVIGHGTNMAGLVGAKGLDGVTGSAPECNFLIIKLKEAKTSNLKLIGVNDRKNIPIYEGLDIYLAMLFVMNYKDSNSLIPISILLSTGTNWGGHEGLTSIEQDIDYFSSRKGLIFVTCSGNQGANATHSEGRFLKSNSQNIVEFIVGPKESNLSVMLWIQRPDKISISVVSPGGEVSQPIQPKLAATEFEEIISVVEDSTISILFSSSEFTTGNQVVYIAIKNPKEGLWQLRLKGDFIINGKYDVWLPQRPLIEPTTRIISSTPYNTIEIPGNAKKAITTAFYNQNNNTVVVDSGRGYTADNRIKPNLATGGIMVLTTGLNNENAVVSGSSAAGAVLCGATLLMLEWGIILGNDPNMYGPTIISYLTRGTSRRAGDIYPNPEWGYGMLNLQGSFENLRTTSLFRNYNKCNIKTKSHLPSIFSINMPKELYRRIDDTMDMEE